jgi:hypothetical protein
MEHHEQNERSSNIHVMYKEIKALNSRFNFLDFICVSMILSMKEELIEDDDTCVMLSLLMHFPNEKNIKQIVKDAYNIRKKILDYLNIGEHYVLCD